MTTLIHTFAGNIGIGTNDPGSYKLNVNGGVKASSIEINGVGGGNTPIGLIAMWYGTVASIPTGWTLCDGVEVARTDGGGNITPPDLRGRMVRSAHGDNPATNYPGQSGGANTVTLSEANLAPHTHTANSAAANAPHSHTGSGAAANAPHTHTNQADGAAHSHYVNASNAPHSHGYTRYNTRRGEIPVTIFHPQQMGQYGSSTQSYVNTGGANAPHAHNSNNANANHNHVINATNAPHSHNVTVDTANAPHSHTITVSATGSASAVNIQNPYYILAYIMKY
jgi:microcystin-dependent protein